LLAAILEVPDARAGLNASSTVFVIMMENHNWSDIKGNPNAPYINDTLLPIASHAEAYYNPPGIHPSEPNYLWLEAGTNFGILNNNPPAVNHQSTSNHFVALLKSAGISWKTYQEDIAGTTCPTTSSGSYAVRHNPFAFFDDVTSSGCTTVMRPFAELAGDLANNTLPHYVFITPNLCHDMHDSCGPINNSIKQGDTWLAENLPMILNSAAFQNGVVFITWDEGEGTDGPIGMIVLSPFAKGGGYSNSIHYTHSATLRTWQEIFGVRPFLGDAANGPDLSDLFVAGAIPTASSQNSLSNISTRAHVGTGNDVLIAGFVATGADPKTVLSRALGPSLANAGIAAALLDPKLSLHDHTGAVIATNDDWKSTQSAIQSTGLAPSDDREAAIVMTLSPGAYTAIESGKNSTTGIGLIEVYDLEQSGTAKIANISTRGSVGSGNNVMIGGLIVGGDGAGARVLVRAIGPSLATSGILDPLPNPMLQLHDANGAVIGADADWKDVQQLEIQATGLAPGDDKEAAILATLSPGAFTAIVIGENGGTGVSLVEIYRLP
jgi:hypothetical protein